MGKLAAVYYEVAYRVDSSQLKRADNELKKADGSVTMINKKTNTFPEYFGKVYKFKWRETYKGLN